MLSELEGVELLQQPLSSNLTLTNYSTLVNQITFDSNQQRSFSYSFIGRQCNTTSWIILKSANSAFTISDTGSCTNTVFPSVDIIITEDSG
jgi:hypothetical protein